MKITINKNITLDRKPTVKQHIIEISRGLNYEVNTNIKNLSEGIKAGYVFCPAIFDGSRSNNNWVSQSLFGLDFDSGITIEEVTDRLKAFDVKPNIIYTTFSDKPEHRKFRVLLELDTVITNIIERNWFTDALLILFPEADKAVRDAARLFYPGKHIVEVNEEKVAYEGLKDTLDTICPIRDIKVNTIPVERTSRQYGEGYTEKALKLVDNYMKKHNIEFYNGNKHKHNVTYAAMCNHFGISEFDCLNELVFRGESSSKTSDRVKDIYKRYSNQFGIKNAENDLRPSIPKNNIKHTYSVKAA